MGHSGGVSPPPPPFILEWSRYLNGGGAGADGGAGHPQTSGLRGGWGGCKPRPPPRPPPRPGPKLPLPQPAGGGWGMGREGELGALGGAGRGRGPAAPPINGRIFFFFFNKKSAEFGEFLCGGGEGVGGDSPPAKGSHAFGGGGYFPLQHPPGGLWEGLNNAVCRFMQMTPRPHGTPRPWVMRTPR